jgi:hypothetical protein
LLRPDLSGELFLQLTHKKLQKRSFQSAASMNSNTLACNTTSWFWWLPSLTDFWQEVKAVERLRFENKIKTV